MVNNAESMRNLFLIACVGMAALGQTVELPAPKYGPSLRRLYTYPLIHGRSPAGAQMSPNGKQIIFGWNETGARRRDVWIMDYPSGSKRRILESDKIDRFPRQDDTRTDLQKREELLYDDGIASYQWAPGSDEILLGPYRGRTWLMKPDGSDLRAIFDAQDQVSSAQFSPDGKYVGFIRGANLYRYERSSGRIKQLTFLSKPNTAVGGYMWSPSGKQIAISWADNSKMGRHSMMDFSKEKAEVVAITRMWNGEKSTDVQVGILPTDGGMIKWVSDLPRYMWVEAWDWSPDGEWLSIGWISEDFKNYTVSNVRAGTMVKIDAYREKAPSNYIPDFRKLRWSQDSSRLYFTTDILDGKWTNRILRKMDAYGEKQENVYAESHDIANFARPKNSDRLFIVTQSRSPLMTEITIQEPDGKRSQHTVLEDGSATPVQFDDCDNPLVSDDGKMVATLANKRSQNQELFAVLPRAARLTKSQLPEWEQLKWANYERVTFPGPDGKPIGALLITRPGLDKSKKHPTVISSLYANSAKEKWSGYIENYMAMELDFVVLQVDFRGSWGYGGEFNSGYYQSMGIIDTQEAVAAKKYLDSLGYVRSDRQSVWGWSYGGFLTCMIMLTAPGVFDTGVAVASVTDWKSYNEWYTRRRLGLASEEAEVFKKTSPVHFAKGLEGNLLLVHGMLDDNVLYQDTARLIENLIIEGKSFDTFAYPRGDHGMWREHESPHVWELIVGYLYEKLMRP